MFNSFYRVKITGHSPEIFLRKLITLGFSLEEVKLTKDHLIILITEADYEKLMDLKTTYKIEVLNRFGYAKYRYLFQKYAIFLIALFFSFFVLQFLSHLVLKVEVIHTKGEIRDLVLSELEKRGISPYHFKVSFEKKEQIADQILESKKDKLEWMEIEEVGTTYRVNVEERKKKKEKVSKEEQNIIAKKAGRILAIEASHGEIVKKKNDYVQKGDIIISGIIKNKEDPVSKVRAEGKVFAEVWYKVKVEVPTHYKEERKTGKSKKRLEIEFLNKSYSLFDFHPYSHSDKKRSYLLKSPLLPISLSYTTFQEIKIENEIHNEKEALKKSLDLARRKLKMKLTEEDEIISQKTLKKSRKNSKIIVEMFFKVKENITDTSSLKNVKLEQLQEKAKEEGE